MATPRDANAQAELDRANATPPSTEANLQAISNDIEKGGNGASGAIPQTTNAAPMSSVGNTYAQANLDASNGSTTPGSSYTPTPNALGTGAAAQPNALAGTTFSNGPKKETAVKDVYTFASATPVNSIQTAQAKPAATAVATTSLKGSKPASKAKGGTVVGNALIDAAKKLTAVNKDIVDARMKYSIPKIHLGIKALPAGCGDNLTKSLFAGINKANRLIASINGVKVKLPLKNIKCLLAIGGLINDISGIADGFSMPDPEAQSTGFSSLVSSALMIGMMGAFALVLNKVTAKPIINRTAKKVAPHVVKHSDTKSLHDMSKLTSKGALKKTNPSLIRDFSKAYTKPAGATNSGHKDTHVILMDSYATIDPTWNSTARAGGGVAIVDLTKIIGASPDFHQTIKTGINANKDVANKPLLLASVMKPTSVTGALTKHFASTALSTNNGSSSKPVNPVSMQAANASKLTLVKKPTFVPDVVTNSFVKNPDGTTTRTITTTTSVGVVTTKVVIIAANGSIAA